MLENNNKRVVSLLAARHYKKNGFRNLVCIIAIVLTAFMLITVFSIGYNYISAYTIQQTRLSGTVANASVKDISFDEYTRLREDERVKCAGIRRDVINVGNVEYDGAVSNMLFGFRYYDKDEWENHRSPALTNIIGNYPEAEQEIMIPGWVLKKMGIESPSIGMVIPLRFRLRGEMQKRDFILSGYFDEYDNPINDGGRGYLLVSKIFSDKNAEGSISAWISFNKNLSEEEYARFEYEFMNPRPDENEVAYINASSDKRLSPVATPDTGDNISIIVLIVVVALSIVICGYLLIYNTFFVSIVNNVRYFGLLKGIGITRKQIRGIMLLEGIRMVAPGIILGGGSGYIFSSFIIPSFLKNVLGGEYYSVGCDVWVVVATCVFTVATVVASMRRPAAFAGKASPIEAQRYGAQKRDKSRTKRKRTDINNKYMWLKMAVGNVLKEKRKYFLVLVSVSLGVIACLLISTTVSSLDADSFVEKYMKADIRLENKTLSLGFGEEKQVISRNLIEKTESAPGVKNVKVKRQQLVSSVYESQIFERQLRNVGAVENGVSMNEAEKGYLSDIVKPELFFSHLVETDFDDEFRKSHPNIDWNGFDNGDICLVALSDPKCFDIGTSIKYILGSYNGSECKADLSSITGSVNIGGIVDEEFGKEGSVRTIPPHYLVSGSFFDKNSIEGIIAKVLIDTETNMEQMVCDEIKAFLNEEKSGDEIIMVSSVETREGLDRTKLTMYGIGGSLAVLIAVIGIVNFINYTYTGIVERRRDFTVMESVGVQKKQIRRMVTYEGLFYFISVMAIVTTLGNLLIYGAFLIFSRIMDYAVFRYPIELFGIISVLMLAVCFVVPRMAILKESRKSVYERLKFGE